MKFKVSRTSVYSGGQPCTGARRETGVFVDERTLKTPTEFNKKFPAAAPWESEGSNHRTTKAGIARDFPEMQWVIDIHTLEGLMEFAKEYGRLVVSDGEIEIYDDYRE